MEKALENQKGRNVVLEGIGGSELVGCVKDSEDTANAKAARRIDSIYNDMSASTGAMMDEL